MQVSPDKNVRVEQAGPIGRIPVSPEYAAGLKNGDFLVATVEQVRGDTLLLRAEDGSLLNAVLTGDMSLAQGDVIEAAVSKDGGTCLLYILNVLHTGAQPAKDTAVSVTPQILSAMLSLLKRNPGLDAEIALFLAENNIPDTAENIAALTQMSRGTGVGALLGRILELMAQPETAQDGGPQPPGGGSRRGLRPRRARPWPQMRIWLSQAANPRSLGSRGRGPPAAGGERSPGRDTIPGPGAGERVSDCRSRSGNERRRYPADGTPAGSGGVGADPRCPAWRRMRAANQAPCPERIRKGRRRKAQGEVRPN